MSSLLADEIIQVFMCIFCLYFVTFNNSIIVKLTSIIGLVYYGMKNRLSNDQRDMLFRIIVYIIAFYFTFLATSLQVNIIGIVIFISHLGKDFFTIGGKWPLICEYLGIVWGVTLIDGGMKSNDTFVTVVGLMKLAAHLHQLSTESNRYYY